MLTHRVPTICAVAMSAGGDPRSKVSCHLIKNEDAAQVVALDADTDPFIVKVGRKTILRWLGCDRASTRSPRSPICYRGYCIKLDDELVVAAVIFCNSHHFRKRNRRELMWIKTSKAHRRLGFATALLVHTLSKTCERSYSVDVKCRPLNAHAKALYRRVGFSLHQQSGYHGHETWGRSRASSVTTTNSNGQQTPNFCDVAPVNIVTAKRVRTAP